MEIYLLKFSACLLVLWLVYVLLLEREKIHLFKRFYLLGSFAIALIIPLLTLTKYVEPIVQGFEVNPMPITLENSLTDKAIEETSTLNLETILWYIYGLGVLIFSIRFVANLIKLYLNILKNKRVFKRSFVYVLLKEYRIPHSFFKYIFLNQTKFETDTIPKEVLLHEETHAKQLHSLDIIILELIQIMLWFHPLIYVLKHHVKLNHEFLADQAVINQGIATKTYQHILLQFSSNTQDYQFSSAINYSSFKKRFTVMKTQTSKTRTWLSTLSLLPIIAILFYSFAEHKEVVKELNVPNESSLFLVTVEKNKNTIDLKCQSGCKWSHIRLEPRTTPYIINDYGFSEGKTIDKDKFTFSIKPNSDGVELSGLKGTAWKDLEFSLKKNQKQSINQLGVTTIISEFEKEKTEKIITITAINNTLYIGQKESSIDTYIKDLNKITRDWPTEDFEQITFVLKTKNCTKGFLDDLNELHKETDHFSITVLGVTPNNSKYNDGYLLEQRKASEKQVEQYNKLAKHYNTMIEEGGNIRIQMKDVEKMKYIYGIMSEEQRKNAETFPDFPKPPPPPEPIELEVIEEQKLPPPPAPNAPEPIKIIEELPEPPAPPAPPKSAHEYVKSLKGSDIIYYFNEKKVSYQKILKITKNNPNINIHTNIKNNKGTVKFWIED